MADIVSRAVRSRMMSGIKGKNTKPEMLVRQSLHRLGFRYSLHTKQIPGKPDLWLPKYNAAVFVHGCFWHGHDCRLFKMPATNQDFWKKKIQRNIMRDREVSLQLETASIRKATVWECAIRGKQEEDIIQVIERLAEWIRSDHSQPLEIRD